MILSVSAGLAYLPFLPLVLAHYGNVIDETGREARDELPRPFRDLSWADDLWGPFYRMALGLMIDPRSMASESACARHLEEIFLEDAD